jgi:hypothetical protein
MFRGSYISLSHIADRNETDRFTGFRVWLTLDRFGNGWPHRRRNA